VVVARDRVDGVALAKSRLASVILMDDGFQNPALVKHAALIVIDSERGIGNGLVFPAGPLRAPVAAQLARTDALVVIGTGSAAQAVAAAVTAAGKPVLAAHLEPDAAAVAKLKGRRVLAFAGIGDPGRFFRTLRASGIEVAQQEEFADHHRFSAEEIAALVSDARREGLIPVTTEKDLVRLSGDAELAALARELVAFPVTLQFDDAPVLRTFLVDRLFKARENSVRR
jgi:tetraacyldisaccharide 4'-kinase